MSGSGYISVCSNSVDSDRGDEEVDRLVAKEVVSIGTTESGGGSISVYNSHEKMVGTFQSGAAKSGLLNLYDHSGTRIGGFLRGD